MQWCKPQPAVTKLIRAAGAGALPEVGPAQLVLDPVVTLLGPVPDPVDPHNLAQVRHRMRATDAPPGAVRMGPRYGFP